MKLFIIYLYLNKKVSKYMFVYSRSLDFQLLWNCSLIKWSNKQSVQNGKSKYDFEAAQNYWIIAVGKYSVSVPINYLREIWVKLCFTGSLQSPECCIRIMLGVSLILLVSLGLCRAQLGQSPTVNPNTNNIPIIYFQVTLASFLYLFLTFGSFYVNFE